MLEVGSLDINGSVRDLFPPCDYIGVDLQEGPGVDVVVSGENYLNHPSRAECFDIVVCCEVLEHAPRWKTLVNGITRTLKPGGWFLMTCATYPRVSHSAVDGGALREGEYYENVLRDDFVAVAQTCGLKGKTYVDPYLGDLYARLQKPPSLRLVQ